GAPQGSCCSGSWITNETAGDRPGLVDQLLVQMLHDLLEPLKFVLALKPGCLEPLKFASGRHLAGHYTNSGRRVCQSTARSKTRAARSRVSSAKAGPSNWR